MNIPSLDSPTCIPAPESCTTAAIETLAIRLLQELARRVVVDLDEGRSRAACMEIRRHLPAHSIFEKEALEVIAKAATQIKENP